MNNNYLKYYSLLNNNFHVENYIKEIKRIYNITVNIDTEYCYYLIFNPDDENINLKQFHQNNFDKIKYLLSDDVLNPDLTVESHFKDESFIVEIGPRLTFKTPFCTNAIDAFKAANVTNISRIERSIRYKISSKNNNLPLNIKVDELFKIFGDSMLECLYKNDINFDIKNDKKENVYEIDVMDDKNGKNNLMKANIELGLSLDNIDFEYYYNLFKNLIKKNPTDVELFDLAQSNSEHSRHWFFKGNLHVNGQLKNDNLFKIIQNTQNYSNNNNIIKFNDNSSGIHGYTTEYLTSKNPTASSKLILKNKKRDIIYTAETHNFPTGVCPFSGANTGTGGRIRDVHATGRGAHEIAGICGYSVGNLNLDNYNLPWENKDFIYPNNFASPKKILIEASNGASDYGNKFGEPVICGFVRSFGMQIDDKRYEYIKPIMFSGGIGTIDSDLIKKQECKKGQLIAKFGGPVYRIGVGGGTASSVQVQGDQQDELDFGAVQRGDPEMEQKLHRLIRSCIELDDDNPILSIHDQGAGGNGNVLKEILEGNEGGGIIYADKFELGDKTISIRELWGAEYQENDAALINPKKLFELKKISKREKCNINIVGNVTGDNHVILKNYNNHQPNNPVDLNLHLLGERENKDFYLTTNYPKSKSLNLPKNLTIIEALNHVLRLPSVSSKRYLTNKVDRSVTGLIVQQQCVGPLHTPVADVAVVALSYFDTVGAAVAVGEQPIKGMIDANIGARMSVGEALTNLVMAKISAIEDVKCSGNWMWAAKIEGEGGKLVEACDAMCEVMKYLGIAIDGGKDSLSMAARLKNNEIVCSPGTLVISTYAPCPNIYKVITPDLKTPNTQETVLLHIYMSSNDEKSRLGGSALAQCYNQLGDTFPDMDDPKYFKNAFNLVQDLINNDLILSGHDISDGGFITTVLEMAFSGNCSINLNINTDNVIDTLFAEELGVILEVPKEHLDTVMDSCKSSNINVKKIGYALPVYGSDATVKITVNNDTVFNDKLNFLRDMWEETSDNLELLQTNAVCVKEQIEYRNTVKKINYKVNFDYSIPKTIEDRRPKIAILREEGSNGDREMGAAFMMSGFEVFDVTMTDLVDGLKLDQFKGIAFVGGFSYADVLGSAKGWSASIIYNEKIKNEFFNFKNRKDTFSFGICNGCQLMGLIEWIGDSEHHKGKIFLDKNKCSRFHSGFCTVKIEKSPSIMLKTMENSILGVWTSHGEGQFNYDSNLTLEKLESSNLTCIRYCNENGKNAMIYPENPNGSINSIAGICSNDGRHLAMMPHPDRSFLDWQWPNYPENLKLENGTNYSPWIKIFRNAYEWCISN